ncbi:ribonuclease H-like domain-containing protein [Peribacillus kribbensis]|uniref:ribonuclease H-like domain-containing protein n=1 Tax=Peribacillus kribbensis TaxID=356658 RepID=UPI000424C999|nr:ribonuclease H-like domain-containing protein [Peribacillus kribbensis]
MSLKSKLGRLKGHMTLNTEAPSEPVNSNPVREKEEGGASIPFEQVWAEHSTGTYKMDGQFCLIREVHYPVDYQHGIYTLKEARKAVEEWNAVSYTHPLSSKGLRVEDMFFFDTETTGLGGGVGNTIFLLGYAFFHEKTVTVRQHILPQPGFEIPLYQSFLEKVNYHTLVTYNGKAFDWPQLKTRHTLIRDHVPRLPDYGHFDLYHASRRLWKDDMDKVKLVNVEKNILGIERKDDVPGFLAPYIFFDFVERKDPEGLLGIIRHNELDVLTLITLYAHLSKQLLQKETTGKSLEVARWYMGLGEKEKAVRTYERVLAGNNAEERMAAAHALAFQWKREKQFGKAVNAWLEVSKKGKAEQRIEALIELSKIYEHQEKEYSKARECADSALGILSGLGNSKKRETMELDLLHRLKRLDKKLKTGGWN